MDTNLSALSERLNQLRSYIEHENSLMNHRLTWLWTLQGLLFAAVGIAPKQSDSFVSLLLCLVGFVSCISIGYILNIGRHILDKLNPQAADLGKLIDEELGLISTGITGKEGRYIQILFPWILLPWFMASVWIFLALYIGIYKPA
jgi:hypothetical protein